ncbi:cell death abnormality protein 1-like, partial [Saccostrea cucullata]|uniref:cell death abnormality protein 1-like n=1 Tax=Saccostrea cuccullata TaxID=36930 RepID=UPI002ED604A8
TDNICERGTCTATQSSTFNGLSAEKVIDGYHDQDERSCSHTAPNKTKAWVLIDLRKKYQVTNIVIIYRNERSWKPYRFRQYRLEVSNSSVTQQWSICYQDRTLYPVVPSSIQNISCEKNTRYLRVFTTYDAPEDDRYGNIGAVLEICEIQVFGCDVGYYGQNCSPCGDCENCNIITGCPKSSCITTFNCIDNHCDGNGNCLRGCKQGYWGNKCQSTCPLYCPLGICNRTNGFCNNCTDGYFGNVCERNCYTKCRGQECDKESGSCTNGCATGYYGLYCNLTCSNTCLNQECTQENGHCNDGCNGGFYGEFCNRSCNINCAQINCSQSGACIYGCKSNWTGQTCDECDINHYGANCYKECSVNCKRQTCNSTTGFCIFGCEDGFYSYKCEKTCSPSCLSGCNRYSGECEGTCPVGKYGDQCDKICNPNCNLRCHKNTGLCEFGCIAGKYGPDCLRTCGGGCISGCSQSDGRCTCKTGWQGHYCDVCSPTHYGLLCDQSCSPLCLNGTCFSNNGLCKEGWNTNLYDIQRIEEMKQASKGISNSAFYGVIAVLLISVILNIYLMVRNVRQTIYKRKNFKETRRHQNSTRQVNTTVNDNVEENTGYQELGDISQPSHYEELKSM